MTDKEKIHALLVAEMENQKNINIAINQIENLDLTLSKQKSNRQFDKSDNLVEDIIKTQDTIIKKLCEYFDLLAIQQKTEIDLILTEKEIQNKKGE